MPGLTKDLYLGKCIADLNKHAELPPALSKNTKPLVKAGGTVYKNAEECRLSGDEERAYTLYMKFLNIVQKVRKSIEYKKDKTYYDAMLNQEHMLEALQQAEKMSASLEKRYEEREARQVAERLAAAEINIEDSLPDISNDDFDDIFDIKPSNGKPDAGRSKNDTKPEPDSGFSSLESPSISPVELMSVITLQEHPLLIDVRSQADYEDSCIKSDLLDMINIPSDHLTPGMLNPKIRQKLSPRDQSLFDARGNYKKIVIIDWNSRYEGLSQTNPINVLKDAIYKWDQQVKLASEPQVLDGGYEAWLQYYPQYSTNPSVKKSVITTKSNIPDLKNVDYDFMFDDEPEVVPDEPMKPTNLDQPSTAYPELPATSSPSNGVHNTNNGGQIMNNLGYPQAQPRPGFPSVDRSNKPSNLMQANIMNNARAAMLNQPPKPQPQQRPSSQADVSRNILPSSAVNPNIQSGTQIHTAGSMPTIDRKLKPGSQQPRGEVRPITDISSGPSQSEENRRLTDNLTEQNRKLLEISSQKVRELNAERQRRMEATASSADKDRQIEDLKRQVEANLKIYHEAKALQEAKNIPAVDRSLKPAELDDWETRLRDLQQEQQEVAADITLSPDIGPATVTNERDNNQQEEAKRSEAKRRADLQSQLIADQNKLARQEQERKTAEKTKKEEELRKSAEKARFEKEERESVERMRQTEEERRRTEAIKREQEARSAKNKRLLADEQAKRQAAEEQARKAEEQRLATELEMRKMVAEKDQMEQEYRKAEEKRKYDEQQRLAAEKAAAEKQRLAAEKAEAERKLAADRAAAEKSKQSSAGELPPGWQKKLDKDGRVFYINHAARETTYTPPPPVSKQPTIPQRPHTGSLPRNTQPSRIPQGSPTTTRSTTRLKSDETTFGVNGEITSNLSSAGSKMKKANSIPNLSKLSDDEDTHAVINFDRGSKPAVTQRPAEERKLVQPLRLDHRRLSNLSPEYGRTTPGLTGLYNMGNTCYMNSALQCLSNTLTLNKYVRDDIYQHHVNRENRKGSKGSVMQEFALLVKCLWTGNYRYIVPRDFKFVFGRTKEFFDHYKQMDSQEFLNELIDLLHEDVNAKGHIQSLPEPEPPSSTPDNVASKMIMDHFKKTNESVILELFNGQSRSTITCNSCGHRSLKFESFNTLPLEIRTSYRTSIDDCMAQYQRTDTVDDFKCGKCGRKDSKKKIDLYHLPPVLVVFFKRFIQHSTAQFSKKTNYIDFPERYPLRGVGDTQTKNYKLYGVVNHYGSMESGHYTAFCHSHQTGRWHKFNDETVTTASSSDIKTSAAYVLFYSAI